MRILCVIDNLGSGGAQRQLVNLAIAFREKGHDVQFLVYHKSDYFKSYLAKSEIEVVEILETNFLKRLFKMRIFIRGGGFDSVLSFLETPNLLCELSGFPTRRWKLVVGERSANPMIVRSLVKRVLRYAHFLADLIICNSKSNLELVRRVNPLLPFRKLSVQYNFIDFQNIPCSSYSREAARPFILLVAASHQYLKNLDGLVEAFLLLPQHIKENMRVHWYGARADDSLPNAQEKIVKYGLEKNFLFLDPTHDILRRMNEADAVGLFSFYEGLPNTICEAMSLGKPVVSSKVSDIPDILAHNADLLFDPGEPKDIASVLLSLFEMNSRELESIGRKNREVAKMIFDKDEIVNAYLKLMSK